MKSWILMLVCALSPISANSDYWTDTENGRAVMQGIRDSEQEPLEQKFLKEQKRQTQAIEENNRLIQREQRAPMMLTAPYYGPIYPAISKYELH